MYLKHTCTPSYVTARFAKQIAYHSCVVHKLRCSRLLLSSCNLVINFYSAEESPDDLMLRSNRNRKMQGSYNMYLIVAAFIAALGGMLFGYDTGGKQQSCVKQLDLTVVNN